MKIIFADRNKSLVKRVKRAIKYFPEKVVEVYEGDIFKHKGIIVSASNPEFSMGGGLDLEIARRCPKECSQVQKLKARSAQRIGNVIFTITVDKDLKSSRELVAKALKFAMWRCKKGETLLLTGSGCGIGGLDEDDFVWLFLEALCNKFKYGCGIKYVRKDSTDFYTGKIKYEVGKWIKQENAPKNGVACDVGLHLGKTFAGAGNYSLPEKILFCLYDKKDICGQDDDKVRVSKLLPLIELPEWLGYGPNGRKCLKNIKRFKPERHNPYVATKLPPIDILGDQVRDQQVWAQVWDQVRDQQVRDQVRDQQVGAQVRALVWDQVRDQVWAQQVWDQVRDQVWAQQVVDQVRDQVWAQVRAQVRDQVWAVAYLAVADVFELEIDHWFVEFIKLGVMVVFVEDKVKVFGKNGKYLGEYDTKELKSKKLK